MSQADSGENLKEVNNVEFGLTCDIDNDLNEWTLRMLLR